MPIINVILFSLLFLQSSSQEEGLVQEDYAKCMQLNFNGAVTTEACTEVITILESTGDYEGQCCRLTFLNDALLAYKRMFGEDWKAKLIEQYELDEDITEDEIREKLGLKKEQNISVFWQRLEKMWYSII